MPKFRSSISNARLTKSLFFEESYGDTSSVLYTLKDVDHLTYPSLYRKYLEMGDLTEFEFANTYFDGYEHWEMLCRTQWFQPYAARWRKELELKIRAQALRAVQAAAGDKSHKSSYEANKYLLSGNWVTDRGKVGRPSKDEIKKQAEELFLQKTDTEEDFKRITN